MKSHATNTSPDLATLRARLAGARGLEYWRSLEELAQSPEFKVICTASFPRKLPSGPMASAAAIF